MYQSKKEYLAMYYFLEDTLSGLGIVNVVNGYPKEGITLPTVALSWTRLTGQALELGNSKLLKRVDFNIDIYAANESQRDDLCYVLFDAFDAPIPVWDIVNGIKTTTKLGCLDTLERDFTVVPLIMDSVDELQYLAIGRVITEYNVF